MSPTKRAKRSSPCPSVGRAKGSRTTLPVVGIGASAGGLEAELEASKKDQQRLIEQLERSNDELRRLNQTIEEGVRERTKWLTLMRDVTHIVDDTPGWDDALRLVLHRVCDVGRWQAGCVYLRDRDRPEEIATSVAYAEGERFETFSAASLKMRFARAQTLPGLAYAGGKPIWVDGQEEVLKLLPLRAESVRQAGIRSAAIFPIAVAGRVIAMLEVFSDQPHQPDAELITLMDSVSAQIGRVLERERLMGQVAELVWSGQQDLIHTLHDTLGQELTGVAFLGASLAQRLKENDPEASETAQRIAEGARKSLERVRQLSKGLFPVDVDAEGLMVALKQLASTTEAVYMIRCRLEYDAPVSIPDHHVATQLYRIAQEAVTNALKHASAQRITIQVSVEGGVTRLTVTDDGVGIRQPESTVNGVGLRIMRYRAMTIGARLSVEHGAERGTTVTCVVREPPGTGG